MTTTTTTGQEKQQRILLKKTASAPAEILEALQTFQHQAALQAARSLAAREWLQLSE